MYDTFVVRMALVIYVLIAGFAVVILGKNSAAPDSMKNCGILLASILPVLIAVLPYLNSEKIEKHFTFALFYDAPNKNIIFGIDRGGCHSPKCRPLWGFTRTAIL